MVCTYKGSSLNLDLMLSGNYVMIMIMLMFIYVCMSLSDMIMIVLHTHTHIYCLIGSPRIILMEE